MSKKRWIVGAVVALVVVLATGATGTGWYVSEGLKPTAPSSAATQISFPPGTGIGPLAEQLEAKGLIRSARVFTWYLKYKKEGGRFQAGQYEMSPGITPDEIVSALNNGETVKETGLRLTVPEGYTLKQVAEKLHEQNGTDAAAFIQAAQAYPAAGASKAAAIPADPRLRAKLEGYLFPETYEWKKDAKPEELIATMVQQLDKRLTQLPADWEQALAARGLSFHQALTLASLIEREVSIDAEKPVVSGVIYNRLKRDMPLQIDATVQYLFDKPKERLFEKDLQIDSPYNTYRNKGLPPGPIASPSLASIRAALYPAETNYLFYVTKKDGSRGHLFAETYEQHKKNIAESGKTASP